MSIRNRKSSSYQEKREKRVKYAQLGRKRMIAAYFHNALQGPIPELMMYPGAVKDRAETRRELDFS